MAEESTLPDVTKLSDDEVVTTPVGKPTKALSSPSAPEKVKVKAKAEAKTKAEAKAVVQKRPATRSTVLKRPAARSDAAEESESMPVKRPATAGAEHGGDSDGPIRAYKEFRKATGSYSIRVKKGDGPKRELFRVWVENLVGSCQFFQVIFGIIQF